MQKAISILLSLLLLTSSTGIAYAKHLCHGTEMLSQITLGEKDLSCGMDEGEDISCELDTENVVDSCCQNHFIKIQTDDNFAKASFDVSFQQFLITSDVSIFLINEIEIVSGKNIFFAEYNPPPIERDLNILYDTFLI